MRSRFLVFILSFALVWSAAAQKPGRPQVDPSTVMQLGTNFSYYNRDHVRLSEDFTAYNEHNKKISKLQFLEALTSAKYLPLHLTSAPGSWAYKLYPFKGHYDKEVADITAQFAGYELDHYKCEGRKFPAFKFTDLNGNVYTNANTKGKILVLKSWFIRCQACNLEMPELNTVVDKYRNRKDILFVSIAFDSKASLIKFNKRKGFKYAIASVPETYIEQKLNTNMYPTHWIINRDGKIVKRTNEPDVMIEAVGRLAGI
ncbi:TlpA family protein disulfide reductase [Mucilaginibacter ximonensis]|uniref:TlpA family protein disulfide reductase n=1 Tax=Mucilaginibacter ximonensis TaxID=538021 RepID=A0ABW5YC88_9SPHI